MGVGGAGFGVGGTGFGVGAFVAAGALVGAGWSVGAGLSVGAGWFTSEVLLGSGAGVLLANGAIGVRVGMPVVSGVAAAVVAVACWVAVALGALVAWIDAVGLASRVAITTVASPLGVTVNTGVFKISTRVG